MRILQVRFKNLNSLVGEWQIELTHPAFASDGIFAITGPTGAGKSTLLDAICLALYGRTPRLNKVTRSANEIMSRQTGECFSEVTFETQAGRFRCHWSQHRARKKPGGELQAPKHEIANADSGLITIASFISPEDARQPRPDLPEGAYIPPDPRLRGAGSITARTWVCCTSRSPRMTTGTPVPSRPTVLFITPRNS